MLIFMRNEVQYMKTCKIPTNTRVIIIALEELIRKSKISGLKKFKGQIDLNINLDVLRNRQ